MAATWVSSLIFVVSLALIFSEKINRMLVALAGAVIMVAAGQILGFYTEEQAAATIDFNTIGLLMGMMILVALLEPTGFFQFLAVWVGRLSKGHPVRLLMLLGGVTTLVSMFLDNVTTVVLIAPVTILICEILGISAQPFLLSEALLSNTGGVATLVGDPPNILIASAADLSFNDFLLHSLPIVLVTWFVALWLLQRLFKDELKPVDLAANQEAIASLKPEEALRDRSTAIKVLIVIGMAILGFLLEELLHVRPAFVALTAAAAGLLWINPNLRETLNRVEWDILIFFAALFVMVGGMESAGVLQALSVLIDKAAILPPVLQGVALLWIVALFSAIVDNVPITIAMVPIIHGLSQMGVDTAHLWWALAFGAGFGGNGTMIGSTANVIVSSLSERTRDPITPLLWSRRGLPVMLVTCLTASLLYILFYYTIGF
ncbi:MAG: ArsB/NhaD family transporter [Chloroflexi bacterium]|nr:ArsB/NhaD family transporter [Chloroflexota bacterium]